MRKHWIARAVAFALVMALALSMASAALAGYSTIPYGQQSTAVRKMQDKLKELGYYKGDIDGKFGPQTLKAVKAFQTAIGITVDGKPGNKTLTALYEGVSAINDVKNRDVKYATNPTNPRTLYYGCTGSRVKELQRALKDAGYYGGKIDGVFGDLTYDAVRKFQYARGLKADGMAGTKTLASLKKHTDVSVSDSFVLSLGSKGDEVRQLKSFLITKGYTVSQGNEFLAVDRDAVIAWQRDNGKTQTGEITEAQYNAIVLGKE